MSSPEISVVLPMYNEAVMVQRVLDAVKAQLFSQDWEIVCVDDGSTDETWAELIRASEADPRIVPLQLSRNFGKESAMAAGLDVARGDAVVLLDADLQHPPELIASMLQRWREGADIVEAAKSDRGREGWVYPWAADAFYALMGTSGPALRGSSDFKLLDRQIVDLIKTMPERTRFLRGLVAWVGFEVARIPFSVAPRAGGTSKWSTVGLALYAVRNLVAFTSLPLRVIAWIATATLLGAATLALQTLWVWASGQAVTGFTTVILVQLGLGGLILMSVGMVALYIAQMYDELKGRPIYIVRRRADACDADQMIAMTRGTGADGRALESSVLAKSGQDMGCDLS